MNCQYVIFFSKPFKYSIKRYARFLSILINGELFKAILMNINLKKKGIANYLASKTMQIQITIYANLWTKSLNQKIFICKNPINLKKIKLTVHQIDKPRSRQTIRRPLDQHTFIKKNEIKGRLLWPLKRILSQLDLGIVKKSHNFLKFILFLFFFLNFLQDLYTPTRLALHNGCTRVCVHVACTWVYSLSID